MGNEPEWRARQAERRRRITNLEAQAADIHNRLVKLWNSGNAAFDLVNEDRKIHSELEEARKDYNIGLMAKP
jgi:hypothetical protein